MLFLINKNGYGCKSNERLSNITLKVKEQRVYSHVGYVHVMWTPRQHDQGTHLICGSAED
jgi:hypothetical protein